METVIITGVVCLALAISYVFFGKEQKIKKYKRSEKARTISVFFEQEINRIGNLEVVGTGSDGNSDVEIVQAIRKIVLPDELRVQIYD